MAADDQNGFQEIINFDKMKEAVINSVSLPFSCNPSLIILVIILPSVQIFYLMLTWLDPGAVHRYVH